METIHEILRQWAHTLWAISWQLTILFGLIGLISLLSWKTSPNFRYWLWCIILLRLCIPFEFKLPVGIGDSVRHTVTTLPSFLTESQDVAAPPQTDANQLTDQVSSLGRGGKVATASEDQKGLINASSLIALLSDSIIIISLWFGLLLANAIIVVRKMRRIRKLLRDSKAVVNPEIVRLFKNLLTKSQHQTKN